MLLKIKRITIYDIHGSEIMWVINESQYVICVTKRNNYGHILNLKMQAKIRRTLQSREGDIFRSFTLSNFSVNPKQSKLLCYSDNVGERRILFSCHDQTKILSMQVDHLKICVWLKRIAELCSRNLKIGHSTHTITYIQRCNYFSKILKINSFYNVHDCCVRCVTNWKRYSLLHNVIHKIQIWVLCNGLSTFAASFKW